MFSIRPVPFTKFYKHFNILILGFKFEIKFSICHIHFVSHATFTVTQSMFHLYMTRLIKNFPQNSF